MQRRDFDTVVVTDPSRLFRDAAAFVEFEHGLLQQGIQLIFAQ
ncbi:recombinase family protein [Paenibacillus forsythiae]